MRCRGSGRARLHAFWAPEDVLCPDDGVGGITTPRTLTPALSTWRQVSTLRSSLASLPFSAPDSDPVAGPSDYQKKQETGNLAYRAKRPNCGNEGRGKIGNRSCRAKARA